jgi:hypothetical protein
MAMPRSQAVDFPSFGALKRLRGHPADRKFLSLYSRNSESSVGQLAGNQDSPCAVAHGCDWLSHDNFAFY